METKNTSDSKGITEIEREVSKSESIETLADNDIRKQIDIKMYKFESVNRIKPTCIYLGFDTLFNLKQQVSHLLGYEIIDSALRMRCMYNGLPIYEVDCAEHLNVG